MFLVRLLVFLSKVMFELLMSKIMLVELRIFNSLADFYNSPSRVLVWVSTSFELVNSYVPFFSTCRSITARIYISDLLIVIFRC